MSIYRLPSNLPTSTKIDYLNEMVMELQGYIEQSKFNKNELDHLYNLLPTPRKYKRNQNLGNLTTDYTDWEHVQAESGYSIWKITPPNYKHSTFNKVYMNDTLLENRGSVASESALTFSKVYRYDGEGSEGYVDNTTEAGTPEGTAFDVLITENDYLYVGSTGKFDGIKFEWHTRGSNYTLALHYWNGSAWTQITANANSLVDGTSNFQGDGSISWNTLSDMSQTAVNGETNYWIRISTTTIPVTSAKAYYIIPSTSVIGVLALSTTEIQNGDWAWCSYSNAVYVTIRNTGNAAYEGNYYITSSSSAANLTNFFVYNNPFTIDYEWHSYLPIVNIQSNSGITDEDGAILVDASSDSIEIDLMTAGELPGKRIVIKLLTIGSGCSVTVTPASGETIDGESTYTFSSDYECLELLSNGTNWYIINKYGG